MYLFDTNIFLEILLSQTKSAKCKELLARYLGKIYISDFSLHSIGVILFRLKKEKVFRKFLSDVLPKIDLISLNESSYENLISIRENSNLDFDDSYQYKIAEDNGFTIVTLDNDFSKIKENIAIELI